ncbi:hypothetical protein NM688_g496 [Phlebia brevispora]|uniref:Uncharacterized protein n=1 Tax=Phlebia brevispora TaxID=194682 RepID=A0ACC1TEC4_9APHY|nr:hypothetical protein NM688_g496 [Phlebia brevispora]
MEAEGNDFPDARSNTPEGIPTPRRSERVARWALIKAALDLDYNFLAFPIENEQECGYVQVVKPELRSFHSSLHTSEEPAYATYWLSGDVRSESVSKASRQPVNGDSMDIDEDVMIDDDEDESEEEEVVPQIKITLVGERELEAAKSKYLRIHSEHIYCLSPSPVTDADLICGPTQLVHKKDESLAADAVTLLGRIAGPHVRRGRYVKPATSSLKADEPSTSKRAQAEQQKAERDTKAKRDAAPEAETRKEEKPVTSAKPKPTGKLDWTKAKTKTKVETSGAKHEAKDEKKRKGKADNAAKMEVDEEGSKAQKTSGRDKPSEEGSASSVKVEEKPGKSTKRPTPPKQTPSDQNVKMQRGVKRKSALPDEIDSEPDAPKSRTKTPTPPVESKGKAGAKLNGKKNVVLSDDEEEAAPAPRNRISKMKGKGKAKPIVPDFDSEAEMSVRAMMDIDDGKLSRIEISGAKFIGRRADHVIKASNKQERQQETPHASEPEDEFEPEPPMTPAEDVLMIDDSDDEPVKPKPRKRKEKKVWPVGRNGFRKRRVMKSRMTVDDKGYMGMFIEDYSDYESVDEEETEAEKEKPKARKSGTKSRKSTTPAEDKTERKPLRASDSYDTHKAKSTSTEKPKRAGSSGKNPQGNLTHFFGKK